MSRSRIKTGKTENALLLKLHENKGRGSVEFFYGRGPEGGWVTEGARKLDAARKLARKDLVAISEQSFHRDGTNYVIARIELTDSGRERAEELKQTSGKHRHTSS